MGALKMKKGLILTNAFYTTTHTQHQIDRLKEEFEKLGVQLEALTNGVLPVMIADEKIVNRLGHYDFIIYLDKDKHIARMLEKSGYRLFNQASSIEVCDDKMLTYIALANHGLAMPKTISSPLLYPSYEDHDFIQQVNRQLAYPIVVKECYGSLGKQVYKADNLEELLLLRTKLKYVAHLYQELVKTSYGKDIRVIVVGGEVVASMLRVSTTDFRSNIANGGKGYPFVLPAIYEKAARKISKLLALDYCGIDFLIGEKEEPLVCEVNSNAFFEEIERVSGKNVAKHYAQHIYQHIYGGK